MDIYPKRPGRPKILIINNWKFGGRGYDLPGYRKDAKDLKEMWEALGCEAHIKENLESQEVKKQLEYFSKGRMTGNSGKIVENCGKTFTAVFILSHGDANDEIFGTDLQSVQASELLKLFDNTNKNMQGMPKLFFFQTCRGGEFYPGESLAHSASFLQLPATQVLIPHVSDLLIAYPCQPETASFVNSNNGSYFIQALVEIFSKYSQGMHLLDMMTLVNKKIATESFDVLSNGQEFRDIMMMSEFRSSLRKHLDIHTGARMAVVRRHLL